MKRTIPISLALVIFLLTASAAFAQNYKVRQTMSLNGQQTETTVYVKGVRKRTEGGGFMGMGGDVATVEQCDLKQNLKISDKKKQYAVEPYAIGEATGEPGRPAAGPQTKAPTTKGGTITYVSNITDTGERKTMFGVTARHVKTSMSVEASADACAKNDMKMETDGWYTDLPDFSCPMALPQMPPQMGQRGGGCQDKVAFRNTGTGKTGFPLQETRTMSMEGGMSFTTTLDPLEFSKATLEAALFDIPQGYTRVADSQQLYGQPDMAAIMRQAEAMNGKSDENRQKGNDQSRSDRNSAMPSAGSQKRAGMVRVGVLVPTNRGDSVSTTNLQAYLVEQLTSGNVEAVSVGSEADAKAAGCDYILSSDISKLKQSTAGKVGGIFGKVTSIPTGGGSYDAQVDFKLTSLKSGQSVLQSKASGKTETDASRAAESILAQEATAVLGAAKP